jgi:hypothetical protein
LGDQEASRLNEDLDMSQSITIGFGADSGSPHFAIHIPEGKADPIVFAEHTVDLEPVQHAAFDRHTWSALAFVLRGEFNKRLKANGCAGSKWTTGYNAIEHTLGSEAICLLCAIEQQPTHVRAILENWMLLLPHERLWLSAQARSSSAWRAGIATALAGDGSAEDRWRTAA